MTLKMFSSLQTFECMESGKSRRVRSQSVEKQFENNSTQVDFNSELFLPKTSGDAILQISLPKTVTEGSIGTGVTTYEQQAVQFQYLL